MSNRSGGPAPPLFSVFCFSKRPPARHPEAARPPTDPEIKNARPKCSGPQSSALGIYGTVLSFLMCIPEGGLLCADRVCDEERLRRCQFLFCHHRQGTPEREKWGAEQ